jgi:hypothetical protein
MGDIRLLGRAGDWPGDKCTEPARDTTTPPPAPLLLLPTLVALEMKRLAVGAVTPALTLRMAGVSLLTYGSSGDAESVADLFRLCPSAADGAAVSSFRGFFPTLSGGFRCTGDGCCCCGASDGATSAEVAVVVVSLAAAAAPLST